MSDSPGSYLVIDPGRSMGFAYCLAGGENIRHGTWKFNQKSAGEAYATFVQYLKRTLSALPDPLVGIELMTIVDHGTPVASQPSMRSRSSSRRAGLPMHRLCVTRWGCGIRSS
ncbi:hypothetical protein HGG76_11840 [Ochrobactrum tritici]|uniref:Holliday junction resolvase RuvC n=1 Tax=Brucella tritici TaxID=94626 RepID=A0A7X6FQI3_9HYPH|nr:hypothetical protein [Brucella tritici]